MALYFEDMPAGTIDRYGHAEVTRDEVLAFATAYDPQPFHLDDEAAAATPIFGRLAASGWHTAAMTMRMTVDHWRETGFASLGSPGLEELAWLRPVYPGDVLRVEAEVLEARASASRAELGFLKIRTIVRNQNDEPVMRQIATLMVRRRPFQSVDPALSDR